MKKQPLNQLIEANNHYNRDFREYLLGTLDNQKIFNLGSNFGKLSQYLDSGDLYMRQGILSKAVKGHDSSIDLNKFESLPQKLAQPTQIFKSKKPDSIVVVLDSITDTKRQFAVVAIQMHHRRFIGQTPDNISVITSIHGRPLSQLLKWRKEGLELYYNKNKNSAYSNQSGAIPNREISGAVNRDTNIHSNQLGTIPSVGVNKGFKNNTNV
jgi:hypothetical protein